MSQEQELLYLRELRKEFHVILVFYSGLRLEYERRELCDVPDRSNNICWNSRDYETQTCVIVDPSLVFTQWVLEINPRIVLAAETQKNLKKKKIKSFLQRTMSLSQKHAGLILVPWFNSDEWRYVYQSVYSNDRDKQLKALELLKIWKLRTPILSTGVEGTLILLDVLLLDTDSLSSEQVSSLYSIALMRFLNLSAANSEKQGSFMRTSAKNELPKWLINLRHDIAHGHQIPSLYNLKMGLEFGFDWLKEKYWEPQSKIIKDYYVGNDLDADNHLSSFLDLYADINATLFENQELDDECVESIKQTIYKKLKKTVAHPHFMLDILLEMITQSLEKGCRREQLRLDGVVSPKALLKSNYLILLEEEGMYKIDETFRNTWQRLLNLLHQYGLLFVIIDKLFDVMGDISHSDNSKMMAAMWMNELFISLKSLKDLGKTEGHTLKLESNQFLYIKEALNLENRVLNCSNKHSLYFIDSLLKYNNDDPFYRDVLTLVNARSDVDNIHEAGGKVYTLQDLKLENIVLEDVRMEECIPSLVYSRPIISGSKWKKIEDTSMFKGCPLGILPHQVGQKHPFLVLC